MRGLTLKTTAFIVLMVFILPMISFIAPQMAPITGMGDTANAATALINKAQSATYRSNSGSFTSSGYYATAFPADSTNAVKPTLMFDGNPATRHYNDSSTATPFGAMFIFNDSCDKKVNKIYLDMGTDTAGLQSQCPGKITFIQKTTALTSFTRTSFSGTTIPGQLYRSSDNALIDDDSSKGITSATAVSNSAPTGSTTSINMTSVSARRGQYYFIPNAPIDAKQIALIVSTNQANTGTGRLGLNEMQLYDVKGENVDFTAGETFPSQVILDHATTQNVDLPILVKDSASHNVSSAIINAVTVTATSVDGGVLPTGVSVDTSIPTTPKLIVAPEATAGAVRITWAYTDSADTYPTSQTSAAPITKDITLDEKISVTGVSLNKEATTIITGNTETLTASVVPEDANYKTVLWTSSNISVAKVNEQGVVTAIGDGEADITATTTDGGFTAVCKVTVIGAVTGVSLTKETTSIAVGNTETLVANIMPPEAVNKNIMWLSSDGSVATVDDFGVVKALSIGETTITAITFDGGYSDTCIVTVTEGSSATKYSITGTVSGITNADLTKVSIVAKQAGTTIDTVQALADGTFSISLEPGVYTFSIGRAGYLKKIFTDITVTTESSQVLSATAINLVAGDVVVTAQNTIDLQDLQTILTNFGLASSDLSFNTIYDLNDDGTINLVDLQAVLKNFGSVQ